MALISDNSNQRSVAPSGIDVFTKYSNGTGVNNVINAEIWDKLETAIYRTQSHGQNVLHVDANVGFRNQRRITIAATGLVSAPSATVTFNVPFTALQSGLFSNSPFQIFNSIFVNVRALTGTTAAYFVTYQPYVSAGVNGVLVTIQNMDLVTNVAAGLYHISVTVTGG